LNSSNQVAVLLGQGSLGRGNGAFQPPTTVSTANGPWMPVLADLNGDGNLDLAVTDAGAGKVSVFLGDGTGAFSAASGSPITVGTTPHRIVAGDFKKDGIYDLAVGTSSDVSVLIGNGAGTFATRVSYPLGTTAADLAVADFNSDGMADLAATGADGSLH